MKYLNKVNCPKDVKKLPPKVLKYLCKDIRRFLIDSVSKTGGHLSSNLGIVELTVALHYCFNSPKDKLIWDVGHQAYVHKILTGRKDKFNTLRKLGGLSGFPKIEESAHDIFNVGHSSTSVSAGLGMALSRDLKGENYNVVSIIGDGSMSGGLAYEGLNNAGRADTKFIVILNDNQMSISENVGAMSGYLSNIRTAPIYLDVKADLSEMLNKIPKVGPQINKLAEKAKDTIKSVLVEGEIFGQLGFNYIGPIDGHNLEQLIKVLQKVKKMNSPVILHVYTTKGKGYERAERAPDTFHGVETFNIETGKSIVTKFYDTYTDVFGKTLLNLANDNNKIVAVTAAMPLGTGLSEFSQKLPNRVFDVGIAESHAVTFSAAMAANGFVPVFAVYSTFLQRAYDQILHDVCIQNLHVVLAVDRAGIVGSDGETHQGLFDISFLSHMPNMTILAPKNKYEFSEMLKFATDFDAPIAVRYPRGSASRILKQFNSDIQYAKSEFIEKGEKIAIISVGAMMEQAYEVSKELKTRGINPTLINARFIKPLDTEMVCSLSEYEHVFVLEDGVKIGGYCSLIQQELSRQQIIGTKVYSFAFEDRFVEHGSRDELFKKYELDSSSILKKILGMMEWND